MHGLGLSHRLDFCRDQCIDRYQSFALASDQQWIDFELAYPWGCQEDIAKQLCGTDQGFDIGTRLASISLQ